MTSGVFGHCRRPAHHKAPLMPEPELQIHYFKDTDSLILTSGKPGIYGETVAKQPIARSNDAGEVTGIELFKAAHLLRPILFPESTEKG